MDQFGCKFLPRPDQVKSIILEVAHKEIIQCPLYITDSWSSPLSVMRKADFPNIHQVEKLFEEAKPTNKKVLGLISANCINSAEREAVSYFQRYIRGVDREKLTKFLRFCTGSTMSCVQKITLMFTHLDGFQRRLVGHTCGAVFRVACHLPIFSPVVRK